jgi:hypothetical protein
MQTIETPAPAAPAAATPPIDSLGKLEQIDQLLRGGTTEPEKVDEAAPESAPDPAAAVEPEKAPIDYTQEVPLSNGEKVTLGALKDAYQAQAQQVLAITEREQTVARQLAEVRDLTEALQALPPEKVEQVIQDRREYARQQHQAMLDAIPAWKDAGKFEAGRKAIHDLAESYGPDAQQMVGQLVNATAVRMLHDYATLRAAVKAAAATTKPVTQPKPTTQPVTSPQDQTAALINRARQTKTAGDQQAAIHSLLTKR